MAISSKYQLPVVCASALMFPPTEKDCPAPPVVRVADPANSEKFSRALITSEPPAGEASYCISIAYQVFADRADETDPTAAPVELLPFQSFNVPSDSKVIEALIAVAGVSPALNVNIVLLAEGSVAYLK